VFCVILTGAAFQAKGRISRADRLRFPSVPRQILSRLNRAAFGTMPSRPS
jgi:hypothetical protein